MKIYMITNYKIINNKITNYRRREFCRTAGP